MTFHPELPLTAFAAPIAEQIWDMKYRLKSADGMPVDVLTVENIAKVFGMQVLVDKNPRSQNVRITPIFVHGES